MKKSLHLAITADLHWGHRHGMDESRALIESLHQQTPDVLILAGDIGTGILFGDALAQFAELDCHKLLVPGNHDLWVEPEAGRDSLQRYQEDLPIISRDHGFHYLDAEPFFIPEYDLGIVGSINWYDFSWAKERLAVLYPGDLWRLEEMRFPRGRHNDARFVRWPLDHGSFTTQVVDKMELHLQQALSQVSNLIVVTHHPPFYDISFPRVAPPLLLGHVLWDAFGGNQRMQDLLQSHAEQIAFAFCGHTHRRRVGRLGSIQGYNVGSDYSFKRLIRLTWPEGVIQTTVLGEATH